MRSAGLAGGEACRGTITLVSAAAVAGGSAGGSAGGGLAGGYLRED